jgi:carbohydrate diacid regulator
MTNVLQELEEITETDIALVSRNMEVLKDFSSGKTPDKDVLSSFIQSAADSMQVRDSIYTKIGDENKIDYILIISGEGAEVVSRIAISEIRGFIAVTQERADKNRFIQSILLDNVLPIDIREDAVKLKIRDDVPRAVFLVKVPEQNMSYALQTLKAMYSSNGKTFVVSVDTDHIAVVMEEKSNEVSDEMKQTAFMISDMMNTEAMIPVRVSCGTPVWQLVNLSQSYKEAQLAMEVGRIFYPDRRVISYDKLGIGRLIYQLPKSLCEMFLRETFDRDVFAELDDEAMATIRQFFANDLNISETARKLYIHRNTLVYRIEKLQKVTGLDIRKFDEAMTFKIAMMVNDYLHAN